MIPPQAFGLSILTNASTVNELSGIFLANFSSIRMCWLFSKMSNPSLSYLAGCWSFPTAFCLHFRVSPEILLLVGFHSKRTFASVLVEKATVKAVDTAKPRRIDFLINMHRR